jgi:glycosyltransferase involved in cell wall biosynthesis
MGGGGAERQLTYLARGLADLGWRVHVALLRGGPNMARLEASGATIHTMGARSGYDPRLFVGLWSLTGRIGPAILQVWLPQMELHGGLAALTRGIPWVFSERASAGAYPHGLKRRLRVAMARRSNAIVSNSSTGASHWRDELGNRVRRYVIPNAVPVREIAETPPDEAHRTSEPLVLFAGRFEAQKNIGTLLDAIDLVRARRQLRVMCCGDGPLRSQIDAWIERRGTEGTVRVAGYVAELWPVMKCAAMVVSPSLFEGNPNVVLEAMAAGVPLVVSDIAEHRELLDDASAHFVPARSAAALASAIDDVLARPDEARARAVRAMSRVAQYGLPVVARQYDAMYQEILSRPAAGIESNAS